MGDSYPRFGPTAKPCQCTPHHQGGQADNQPIEKTLLLLHCVEETKGDRHDGKTHQSEKSIELEYSRHLTQLDRNPSG